MYLIVAAIPVQLWRHMLERGGVTAQAAFFVRLPTRDPFAVAIHHVCCQMGVFAALAMPTSGNTMCSVETGAFLRATLCVASVLNVMMSFVLRFLDASRRTRGS